MIIAAGLSPAWQQILVFDEVAVGEVNRAREAVWCASGKVLNVARAVWSLGADVAAVCPIGGLSGDAILEEFATDGISAQWISTTAATRVCTTVIERPASRVTEFVENARAITADELSEFEAAYLQSMRDADLAVLTGSLPEVEGQGQPVELYRRLLEYGPRAILDVRGPELQAALPLRPLLVKPNREELAATVGRSLRDQADVFSAMQELNREGAEWVLITSGSGDVFLTSRASAWRFVPPSVDVLNPIGCGDCLAAGVAVAMKEGADMVDAVRFGMAAAAQNASQLLPGRIDRGTAASQAGEVQIHPC